MYTMIDGNNSPDMRGDIARSRLFCALVSPDWLTDPDCQAALATAIALRKPIRLLVIPGVRLPETVALGATDLACFPVPLTPEGHWDQAATSAWVSEQIRLVREQEGA